MTYAFLVSLVALGAAVGFNVYFAMANRDLKKELISTNKNKKELASNLE